MSSDRSKQLVVQSSAPKKITRIQFGTLGSNEIQRISEVQVTNSSLFDFPSRKPISFGPMDSKLGISVRTHLNIYLYTESTSFYVLYILGQSN
jgi:hypothetical protein